MPELDKENGSKMQPIGEIKNVQLNEKVSETRYQILHPETSANQVITNTLKRFVSDEEKARWNLGADNAEVALRYKGEWQEGQFYKKYDVVYTTVSYELDSNLNNTIIDDAIMFFINIDEEGAVAVRSSKPTIYLNSPSHNTGDIWINIDFRSYLASRASTVKISNSTDYDFLSGPTNNKRGALITFTKAGTGEYKTIGVDDEFRYDPESNTLTVLNIKATNIEADKFKGNLEGTADNAIHYVAYSRDPESGQKIEGPTTNVEIDETIVGIKKTLSDITNGGAGVVLGNPLTITKDGENAVVFDGSFPTIVDIKQTYTPKEIDDLLDDTSKIKIKWLPETVLGQLEYQGTWNANPIPRPTEVDVTKQVKGHYYITRVNGNYNPDGSLAGSSSDANPTYYLVGDWAVYNGTSWDKVDNTDAVTMVNSQIGAVEIYKTWSSQRNYFKGDIVKVNGLLYISNTEHMSAGIFTNDLDAGYWDLFGRSYTAEDGIKIENNSIIKHDTVNPNALENTTTQDVTLTKDQTIAVPALTYDNFGHVSKVEIKNVTLGEDFIDTVREIKVKGAKALDKTDRATALDFRATPWIEPSFENNLLYFKHKTNGSTGAKDFSSKKITETIEGEDILYAGQGYSIPSFSIDAAGHVVSGAMKNFKIASNFFKHAHFNIAPEESGSLLISAVPADQILADWFQKPENLLKFYLGTVNPAITEEQMNFYGQFNAVKLKQRGYEVLDSRIKLYNGLDMSGKALYGSFVSNSDGGYIESPDSGVNTGVYSAVAVNSKGIVTAGGHIIEFGKSKNADPSDALAIGGLFFRWIDPSDTNS